MLKEKLWIFVIFKMNILVTNGKSNLSLLRTHEVGRLHYTSQSYEIRGPACYGNGRQWSYGAQHRASCATRIEHLLNVHRSDHC